MGQPVLSRPLPTLLEHYRRQVVPALMKQFGYRNPYEVPRLEKVVLNMGVGPGAQDVKLIEKASEELAVISGQKPLITRAKKSIANFKLKKGQPVGCKVTLRRVRMYDFLERLIHFAIPRIRDFRGLDPRRGFDQGGNYAFGVSEQLIFPEIEYDKVTRIQGMDIVVCTTAKTQREAYALLKALGFPFKE